MKGDVSDKINLFSNVYRGVLLSFLIGALAYAAGLFTPSYLNSILLALIFGMILGNSINLPETFDSGINYAGSKMLEFSLLFLAFSINYSNIADSGAMSFGIITLVVFLMMILTFYLARKLNCPGSTGWLIGFGTAICGSSAIAALAPGVAKDKNDVAIAMAVVNLLGSIAMLVIPFLFSGLHLNTHQSGLLIGGTLHSVGNVAGAGFSLSDAIGQSAITFKLTRVALLTPALLFFNYLVNRKGDKKSSFRLPWYLLAFIAITILSSVVSFPESFIRYMEETGKFFLTIAMAAIGLKVSFLKLFQSGKKGISFGVIIFVIQVLLVAGLMFGSTLL